MKKNCLFDISKGARITYRCPLGEERGYHWIDVKDD